MSQDRLMFVFSFLVFVVLLLGLFALPEAAIARAGGGGGGGGGGSGGPGSIIGLIVFGIYSAIVTFFLAKKRRQTRALLDKLERIERSWGFLELHGRIFDTYFKVQKAWMERNQDLAKDFMSEKLYKKHKAQTDEMIAQNRKNVFEDVNLLQATIIEVADFNDDSKDYFWVVINGSMKDYHVDDRTGKFISGNNEEKEEFKELWKFIRSPAGWVLDEIDPTVELMEIITAKSHSEELAGKG